jgi:hypothetical protein
MREDQRFEKLVAVTDFWLYRNIYKIAHKYNKILIHNGARVSIMVKALRYELEGHELEIR